MAEFTLNGETRELKGKKVRRLRSTGEVPASVYGPVAGTLSVKFPYRALELTLMKAGGTNLIDIVVDGNTYPSLAREVQRDVIKGKILHVDFFAVDTTHKIRVEIPVVLEGQSPVIAAREGILITGPNTLTVEVLPTAILNQIVIDLTQLTAIGQEIMVKDLDLGEGSTIINEPNEMIAKIVQTSAARAALLEADQAEGEGQGEADSQGSEE